MFEHLDEHFEDVDMEGKTRIAEWYLDVYQEVEPVDIYRWLWEGEFGLHRKDVDMSLDRLAEDIRVARIHYRTKQTRVWEPLGLGMRLIRINLVPYADSGCPYKRLIMLEERARDVRPNPLRFKNDWAFMKTQIVPEMHITLDKLNRFEHNIPFHLVPEMDYSEVYQNKYGLGYRIVPRSLFFDYFPEYDLDNDRRL